MIRLSAKRCKVIQSSSSTQWYRAQAAQRWWHQIITLITIYAEFKTSVLCRGWWAEIPWVCFPKATGARCQAEFLGDAVYALHLAHGKWTQSKVLIMLKCNFLLLCFLQNPGQMCINHTYRIMNWQDTMEQKSRLPGHRCLSPPRRRVLCSTQALQILCPRSDSWDLWLQYLKQ